MLAEDLRLPKKLKKKKKVGKKGRGGGRPQKRDKGIQMGAVKEETFLHTWKPPYWWGQGKLWSLGE